nr:MAG TPA: crossover junction endodeoxyribonuclease [Bacteriophage sp.]
MLEIVLPYTPSKLNPNRSKTLNNFEFAREFKKYKQQAYFLTKQALEGKGTLDFTNCEKLSLSLTFYPPDRRKRDDDNMIASFKAGRDGIAQALGIDDNLFHIEKPLIGDPVRPHGQIKVVITIPKTNDCITQKKESAQNKPVEISENNSEVQAVSKQKGRTNNPKGRPKGVPNKMTMAVKEMVLKALNELGGVEYLKSIAQIEPRAFVTLLSKCIPNEVTGKDGKDLVPSGGVLVVPANMDESDWGAAAAAVIAEQEKNKKKYAG